MGSGGRGSRERVDGVAIGAGNCFCFDRNHRKCPFTMSLKPYKSYKGL